MLALKTPKPIQMFLRGEDCHIKRMHNANP